MFSHSYSHSYVCTDDLGIIATTKAASTALLQHAHTQFTAAPLTIVRAISFSTALLHLNPSPKATLDGVITGLAALPPASYSGLLTKL
jgi:hypothetical protein